MTSKIAILGGSSQVGSSVALYLHLFQKARVTVFTRSAYAAPVFDRIGIEHQILELKEERPSQVLSGFDAVLDFSLPLSELWENKKILSTHLKRTIANLNAGTPFISMSTQKAFGYRDSDVFIRKRLTDWASSYCSLKRHGERTAVRFGRQYDVPIFNLRLAQVHGFLQNVSNQLSGEVSFKRRLTITGHGSDLVNTVFIQDIAEAALKIVKRELSPGTYSVLSRPQWTQEQLYRYYQSWCGTTCTLEFIGHRSGPDITDAVFSQFLKLAQRYRSFLEVLVLQRLPGFGPKAKGTHYVRSYRDVSSHRPVDVHQNLLGTPPLAILGDPSGLPARVLEMERKMEDVWLDAIGSSACYAPLLAPTEADGCPV